MTPNAISGSTLSIGYRVAPKILVTESDFDGQEWTEVGGLLTLGSVGLTQNYGSQSMISMGFDVQFKGTKSFNIMENVFSFMPLDAGQIAMNAADNCGTYAFRIDYGGCEDVRVQMFYGQVAPAVWQGGDANTGQVMNWPILVSSVVVDGNLSPPGFSFLLSPVDGFGMLSLDGLYRFIGVS